LSIFVLFSISSVSAWHLNLGIGNQQASELYRNNPNDPLVKQWQEAMMHYMDTANSCLEDTTGTVFTGAGLQGCIVIVQTILENCLTHPNSLLICEDTRLNEYLINKVGDTGKSQITINNKLPIAKSSRVLEFSGNNYADIADTQRISPNSFTISIWFNSEMDATEETVLVNKGIKNKDSDNGKQSQFWVVFDRR
jgi:hypothetical protein